MSCCTQDVPSELVSYICSKAEMGTHTDRMVTHEHLLSVFKSKGNIRYLIVCACSVLNL